MNSIYHCHELLGARIAPDGYEKDEYYELLPTVMIAKACTLNMFYKEPIISNQKSI